ncbi:MAG: hypothetical protein VZR06_11795 [Butyrivibrio sp.]|nr:hypothetical protein [Butyrivibrio sp.]
MVGFEYSFFKIGVLYLQSEMLAFYRIPKLLFTDAYFSGLDALAKTLYGLMLLMKDGHIYSIGDNGVIHIIEDEDIGYAPAFVIDGIKFMPEEYARLRN